MCSYFFVGSANSRLENVDGDTKYVQCTKDKTKVENVKAFNAYCLKNCTKEFSSRSAIDCVLTYSLYAFIGF